MDYLVLLTGCVFFAVQFIFNKVCSKNTASDMSGGLIINIFQSGWIALTFFIANGLKMTYTADSVKFAVLYAFLMILCNCCMAPALKYGKISVLSLFTLAGCLVIPSVFGIIFLKEDVQVSDIVAIVVILISFIISSAEDIMPSKSNDKNEKSEKPKALFWVLCLITFFGNGLVSVVSKLHVISENSVPTYDFLVCASLTRFLIASVIITSIGIANRISQKGTIMQSAFDFFGISGRKSVLPVVLGGLGYGLCNGIGNIFSMKSQKTMNASLQFPLLSATVVVLTALLGFAVYKEKPSKFEIIGMSFTVAGALIMII